MKARGIRLDALLTWVLAGLAVWLGISLRMARADLVAERADTREVKDSARVWRMESRVAHRLAYTITLPDSIPVTDAITGAPTHLHFTGDRVMYVVSPSCAACAENFPAIQALDSAFPGRVIVVTSAPADEARASYAELARAIPVLSVDSDVLHQIVSNAVTPITLVTRGRNRLRFWYGQVSEPVQGDLRRILSDTLPRDRVVTES